MKRKKTSTGKSIFFRRFLLVLFGVFLLGLMELALRLLPIARPPEEEADPFVGFSGLHPLYVTYSAADGSLRAKTAQEKLEWFNPQEFRARKERSTFRIVTLGGSTTYGRPYRNETSFSTWLEKILNSWSKSGTGYEVINAGGISYASYRVAIVLQEILEFDPDLVVIYTGHNEFLEARTYGDFLERPSLLFRGQDLVRRLAVYRLLNRGYRRLRTGQDRETITGDRGSAARLLPPEVETLLDQSAGLDYYRRDTTFARGVFEHFRFNVAKMIGLCRRAGVPVVFCLPVDNIKDFSPFKSVSRADLSSDERLRLTRMIATGSSLVSDGRVTEGLETLQKVVALDPLYAEAHFYLGRAYLAAGDISAARKAFLAARELDVCPLRAQEPIHSILRQETAGAGVDLIDLPALFRSRSANGIIGNEMLVDHIHPVPEGHLLIALEIMGWMAGRGLLKDFQAPEEQKLQQIYTEVMSSLKPEYFSLGIVNLAKVLTWANKFNEVYGLLNSNWEEVSGSGEVQYLMGVALEQLGRPEEAVEHYNRALATFPAGHKSVITHLSRLYERMGRFDRAAEAYSQALDLYPEDAYLLSNYGIMLAKKGQAGKALEFFRRAIQIKPDSPNLYNNLGLVYSMQKQYTGAIEAFEKAVALAPGDPQGYHNLGVVCTYLERPREAEEYFLEALRLDPEHVSSRNNLGNIYRQTGRPALAEEQFRLALVINPDQIEPYINLSQLWIFSPYYVARAEDFGVLSRHKEARRHVARETREFVVQACVHGSPLYFV